MKSDGCSSGRGAGCLGMKHIRCPARSDLGTTPIFVGDASYFGTSGSSPGESLDVPAPDVYAGAVTDGWTSRKGKIMRFYAVMILLTAALCDRGGAGTSYEWERHECEICGKTIWAKVEYGSFATIAIDGMQLTYAFEDIIIGGDDTPRRVTAEKLHAEADYFVCPHCVGKYGESFGKRIRSVAQAFVEEAKTKESDRRKTVAQENTQEELRRAQAELRKYQEQVKKLTEKLDALKSQIE